MTLEEILNDHTSGSREITLNTLHLLLKGDLSITKQIANAHLEMASLQNLHERVLSEQPSPQTIQQWIQEKKSSLERIIAKAKKLFSPSDTILLHSRSSTVLAIMHAINPSKIFVTKSDPGGEGITVHKELPQSTLIEDSEVNNYLPLCDWILVGADAYTDNSFINKIGTKRFVKSTTPLVVAVEQDKKLKSFDSYKYDSDIFEMIERVSISHWIIESSD